MTYLEIWLSDKDIESIKKGEKILRTTLLPTPFNNSNIEVEIKKL